jgi:hypothetical protein
MLIRKHGGFTSVEAQNHLLTFGEYAAMHLLAWSPRIWRGLATEEECYAHVRATGPWTLTKPDPLFSQPVEEREVPRSGIIVTRSFQYARTASGGSVLWLGRRKRVGRGEGVSDLRYDILDRVRTQT